MAPYCYGVKALNEFEVCVQKGLLRKILPSKERAEKSIKKAEEWLAEAQDNFENESYPSCMITSYLVMFHAARAILLKDGFREKSHFCIARFLEEKYAKTGRLEMSWIDMLDRTRELRHDDQYDLDFSASQEEAEDVLKSAKQFLERMKRLVLQSYHFLWD